MTCSLCVTWPCWVSLDPVGPSIPLDNEQVVMSPSLSAAPAVLEVATPGPGPKCEIEESDLYVLHVSGCGLGHKDTRICGNFPCACGAAALQLLSGLLAQWVLQELPTLASPAIHTGSCSDEQLVAEFRTKESEVLPQHDLSCRSKVLTLTVHKKYFVILPKAMFLELVSDNYK